MKKLIILDGGMGRELQEIGAPFSQPFWSAQALMEAPQFVHEAHQHFIDAGAEIITTNSYACVPFHLGLNLYDTKGAALATKAAKIARQCVEENKNGVIVAGSIPPPLGSYRSDLFVEQKAVPVLDALIQAQEPYVDIWIAETLCSVHEFQVTQERLSKSARPCYYAFSLADDVQGPASLRSGETVDALVDVLLESNATGVMFNCSIPEVMEAALIALQPLLKAKGDDFELGIYANNFAPIDNEHEANDTLQCTRELSPQDYVNYAKRWYQLGATIIGGCCGIGPKHIQALSEWKLSPDF
ncbi:homocysteine S-methyltransferase family protein [Vibrio agarivorans]|uniref:Homocysteine S-methyltransferase family protein n=1 Tax=Vibrio agarivorans TaxID=153622 RepID=A0ABT7XZV9_9VIBR|nr:homocysteine S-methyltransferase family protein [Vibrio agarivorans]MDN2481305.1 homocysteine S-methyltransferase family protein [Vibrio agarivorans]